MEKVTLSAVKKSEITAADPNDPQEILKALEKEIVELKHLQKALAAEDKMKEKSHQR